MIVELYSTLGIVYSMRELALFEEACGEFDNYTLDGERIVVVFKDSPSIVVPLSTEKALRSLKPGQRVAIIRINGDRIKVRLE